jgi:hypothetical protein
MILIKNKNGHFILHLNQIILCFKLLCQYPDQAIVLSLTSIRFSVTASTSTAPFTNNCQKGGMTVIKPMETVMMIKAPMIVFEIAPSPPVIAVPSKEYRYNTV